MEIPQGYIMGDVALSSFDANQSGNWKTGELSQAIQSKGYGAADADIIAQNIMFYDADQQISSNEIQGLNITPLSPPSTQAFNKFLQSPTSAATPATAPAQQSTPVEFNQNDFPNSPTQVKFSNEKNYDIALVPRANAGSPEIDGNLIIPANSTVTFDIAKLSQSDTWAGSFEIRSADTMEKTGALLEYNFNTNWGQGENTHFFNVSYINGVAHNSNQQDFINAVAYLPNGIVQGNENGDLNDFLGQYWDQLYGNNPEAKNHYDSGPMMSPKQNGVALNDKNGSGYNQMASLLLNYREQTDSAFYLYEGNASSNFADDEFSQGWSGQSQGMNVRFY